MSDNPKYLRISAELTDDAFVKAVYLASALEIETLDREREEARAAYHKLYGRVGIVLELLGEGKEYPSHEEWRKDGE